MSLLPAGTRWDFDKNLADAQYMAEAIALGEKGLGLCAPNPAVGAILVKGNAIIGRGWTKPGGRPHAETVALAEAGENARGATLFVSLEPCSHQGVTPPCTESIIQAGVSRVVMALRDPDPRVSGRGLAVLQNAGITVDCGLLAREALRANFGFFCRVTRGRPMLTLKLAMTADGYAGAAPGQPRLMITGPAANEFTHRQRAAHDAILIGSGTARDDDPLLTVRLPQLDQRPPLRIILDTRLSLPLHSQLVRSAPSSPTLVIGGEGASKASFSALRQAHVEVELLPRDRKGHLDLQTVMQNLAGRGLTRVLAETGPRLAQALIGNGFADVVILLKSPDRLQGGGGRYALTPDIEALLADRRHYARLEDVQLGPDCLTRYEKVL